MLNLGYWRYHWRKRRIGSACSWTWPWWTLIHSKETSMKDLISTENKHTHTRLGSCTAELYEPYTSKCLILSTPVGWFSSSGSLWVAQGAWRIPASALTLQCSWSRNLPSSGRDFNGENLSYNIKPGTSKALNNISSIKHCMSRHSDMYMYVVYYIYIY